MLRQRVIHKHLALCCSPGMGPRPVMLGQLLAPLAGSLTRLSMRGCRAFKPGTVGGLQRLTRLRTLCLASAKRLTDTGEHSTPPEAMTPYIFVFGACKHIDTDVGQQQMLAPAHWQQQQLVVDFVFVLLPEDAGQPRSKPHSA